MTRPTHLCHGGEEVSYGTLCRPPPIRNSQARAVWPESQACCVSGAGYVHGLLRCVKRLVLLIQGVVQLQNASDITAPVAVVRRAPHGDNRGVKHVLVALEDELVRARDQVEAIRVYEALDDVAAKEASSAAGRDAPPRDIVWIGP